MCAPMADDLSHLILIHTGCLRHCTVRGAVLLYPFTRPVLTSVLENMGQASSSPGAQCPQKRASPDYDETNPLIVATKGVQAQNTDYSHVCGRVVVRIFLYSSSFRFTDILFMIIVERELFSATKLRLPERQRGNPWLIKFVCRVLVLIAC